MKTIFNKFLLTCLLAAGLVVFFIACEKETDQMIPPILEFKTGPAYVSADGTFPKDTTIIVGIHAEKTEGEDYLKTFTISASIDGGPALPVLDSTLTEADHDVFEVDIPLPLTESGVFAFAFTITNRDGLIATKSLTFDVP